MFFSPPRQQFALVAFFLQQRQSLSLFGASFAIEQIAQQQRRA